MNIHCVRNIAFFLLIPLFITACEKEQAKKVEPSLDGGVEQVIAPKATLSKHDELLAKANSGDIEAQFELAEMLNAGNGVPENDAEAFRWYESAVLGKHPKAILALSHAYLMPDTPRAWLDDGDLANNLYLFVQQDKQKAISMVEELAATGNKEAIVSAYYNNVGDNNQKAFYWLKYGASQGDTSLHSVLGIQYFDNEITPRDLVLARAWMHLGIKPKDRYQSMFGKETPEQISLAVELAEKWKPGYDLIRLPNGQYDAVPFVKIDYKKPAAEIASTSAVEHEWQITARGYGPVHAGMTVSDAKRLMGGLTIDSDYNYPSCYHLRAENGHEGVTLMIQDALVTRVEFSPASNAKTLSGIKFGDSLERVKQIYGGQIEISDNGDGGIVYTVWEQGKHNGVSFNFHDGKVSSITAGDESIRLIEGCS